MFMKLRLPSRRQVLEHLIDSTAMNVALNPVFAAFETQVTGLSDETSLQARLLASGLSYAGLGVVFARGRDFSRNLFHISDSSSERAQTFHDTAYLALMNAGFAPVFYSLAGVRDPYELAIGSLIATGIGAASGGLFGYVIDVFRDLTGLQPSQRLPAAIQRLSSKAKKGVAAGLVAASIGLMGGIYALNPDKPAAQKPLAYQASQPVPQVPQLNLATP